MQTTSKTITPRIDRQGIIIAIATRKRHLRKVLQAYLEEYGVGEAPREIIDTLISHSKEMADLCHPDEDYRLFLAATVHKLTPPAAN